MLRRLVGLAVVLALVVGCDGDNGNGTGPGPDTGLFGESASAVESVVDKFITPNEPAFQSLDFFVNLIALALNVSPPATPVGGPSAALLQSCLSPSAEGVTFDYDGQLGGYVPTGLTGAPTNGARFLLYEVNASGELVVPANQFGYLDVACTPPFPTLVMNIEVVVNAVTVVNMDATGSFDLSTLVYSLTIDGSIGTPDGSEQLRFGKPQGVSGTIGASENTEFDYNILPGQDIFAGFSLFDSDLASADFFASAQVFKQTQVGDPGDWSLRIDLAVDASGNVSGPAIFQFPDVGGTGGGTDVVACLSGSYDAPVVGVASLGCAGELPINDLEPNGQAKRDAIRRAYVGLRQLFDPLRLIVNTGLAVAARAVG